ncbi:phage head completion protein [Paraburkholderia susongensis]|uniref:Phage head-tail joining protein n=1 Tax=Paraburkholderia susongensis TaxID=1515439 RepID=A0A1X7I6R6_9BURK|nr:head-tail adaptor protein [Paraburkholderia susongensis]SMG09521.1 Phage head-tail joining protein [Paraburkholderia susongensis]
MSDDFGEMMDYITLRVRTDVPAPDMNLAAQYSYVIHRWARVDPLGPVAYAAGVQSEQRVTHRVRMRFLADATDHHEMVFDGWVYRVRRVKHDRRADRTVLEVEQERMLDAESGSP